MLTQANKIDLATAIESRNPYSFLNPDVHGQGMTLASDWQSEVEESAYTNAAVTFRGTTRSYHKAFSVPYTYQDVHGNTVKEHMLIVFEGSDGE
jgi:hypothetical protein